ncbi:MAG: GNAT family N-acetyltransferase [Burkholderiales bacterium]|nr:GNAT family N-acetyltransferase [Burkholderiales bacterium]
MADMNTPAPTVTSAIVVERALPPRTAAPAPRLVATWARDEAEVRAAQRLRYQVFAEEMGASLSPPPGTAPGLDVDAFDAHCEHLLVRTCETADAPAQVVGTYRVLTPDAARRMGGLYSDTEFDLSPLNPLRPQMAELGRSCTAPQWRSGAVILMLWSSLAEFMHRNHLDLMVGCASVPMGDGGHAAASLWEQLRHSHLAAPEQQVSPRLALPVDELRGDLVVEPPPLIKGYLKCGAKLLGAPAWDPDFGCADLPMMLRLSDLPDSYRRRFLAG